MLVTELIAKKQGGSELAADEIRSLMLGFTRGGIPDYQMSAMLMAIYFQGLSDREGRDFLAAMIDSGRRFPLAAIVDRKVDKHSTGGVGDKTSLIIAPVVAAAGIPVPMISGRALGHTGGTLDKLESIPGFKVQLRESEFETVLREHFLAFGAQTDELVPADRKLYALRDVTSTVSIPPLIAASILSKKIAEGTNALVMDVKLGSGGFLRSTQEAESLAKMLVDWSAAEGVETVVFGSDMSSPLGRAAGNAPEVLEVIDILRTGMGDSRLIELCATLGGAMLWLGGKAKDREEGFREFNRILRSGVGYDKFKDVAIAQGADAASFDEFTTRTKPLNRRQIFAEKDGWISQVDPRKVGWGLVDLGAGRRKSDDPVDPTAGIVFSKRVGDRVTKGDQVASISWSNQSDLAEEGIERISQAVVIDEDKQETQPLLKFYFDRDGMRRFE